MNPNKLTFESENLVVDYISFNISGCTDPEPIANYLSEFGFNSILKSNEKTRAKVLISKIENYHDVTFVKSNYDPLSNSYWDGLSVRFSGKDGNYFYQLIKRKLIDWAVFDLASTNLGRFDLHFLRDLSESEEQLALFMKNSCQKVKSKSSKRHAEYFRRKKGLILEIGSRSSSNRLRVYEKRNFLEFELEIKKGVIKSYQDFLFSDSLEKFEGKLVNHYYKQLKKSLVLDSSYLNWLLVGLRKIVPTQKSENQSNSLVSSYLNENNLDSFFQKEQFFKLIQFLSFLRTLGYSIQFLDNQAYCVIEFAVMDFINFTGSNARSTYQRTKALEFFASLQEIKPLIQKFSNNEFQRSVMFPYLKLKKQNRRWTIRMAVGEELYFYQYPFLFPNYFISYQNKYDLEIKLQLIESFSTVGLEKRFPVRNFLNQFSVPNKELKKIKKQLVDSFSTLKGSELIENEFSLNYKNGSSKKVEDLTSIMISKSESLSFWEKI